MVPVGENIAFGGECGILKKVVMMPGGSGRTAWASGRTARAIAEKTDRERRITVRLTEMPYIAEV